MGHPLRIIFLAADPIALPSLRFLHQPPDDLPVKLVGLVSQPDRPTGRGRKTKPNPAAAWAEEQGLSCWKPEKPDDDLVATLAAEKPDLLLVMAYGHLLKKNIRELAPRGIWNLHASLLPAYRGASPAVGAIAGGETESGVTFMEVVRQMDAGDIVAQEKVPVTETDSGADLEEKIGQASPGLLAQVLPLFCRGEEIPRIFQNDAEASYTRKLRKDDGYLDFHGSAQALARRINALNPWPGAFLEVGESKLKIGRASAGSGKSDEETFGPGRLLPDPSGKLVRIACAEGVLNVLQLQRPGGKMLPAEDFLRGFSFPEKIQFPSHPMEPLVLSAEEWANRQKAHR
ncbi:MAG: methionyl-tRNA formyltransferase [Opitutales bacterium]|nr:methionyl-tRNA formyltransferase [Opitutales bacterium]MCH8539615.1 methionyl-tRNA formyltransferase [Opitutales bacterium]